MALSAGVVALDALSGDEALLRRLRAGSAAAGRVHSVFERAVNVVVDGDLVVLVVAGAGNGPATLVVDVVSFAGRGLAPGAPVVADGGTLLVGGGVAIDLSRARPWAAALPVLGERAVPPALIDRVVAERGGPVDDPAPATARALAEAAAALEAGLRAGDPAAVRAAALALVGLGPGLTPSGDDHLLGVAVACALAGSRGRAGLDVLTSVVDSAAGRTTDVSRAALGHAVRGRVREPLVALAEALCAGDRGALERSVDAVLAIGATSGADVLGGLVSGLRALGAGRD